MANKQFLNPINLVNLATDPSSASEGDIYYNTTSDLVKVYTNGAWVPIGTESFKTIAVTGQSSVVADSSTDTLNLVAGTNVSITTDASTDSITINSTGNYTSVDSITYPDYITFDTIPETIPTAQGSVYWDEGDKALRVVANATSLLVGQDMYATVKNATASSMPKGSVVYINGAQGQRPTIALADADTEITSSKTFGLTAETIAAGAEGIVVTQGILRGLNTLGMTEGEPVYLSGTPGAFTQTKPSAPVNLVSLGYVVKVNQSSGEVYVNIQNGYELAELHDVTIDGTPADNEVLAWDSASGLWKNQTAAEAGLAELSGATFTGDIAVNGGDLTTTATTASLFNANATTLNIGGAATTLSIGSTDHTGTTTINNDLAVYGTITFSQGSSSLSATTITVNDTLISLADNNTADILDLGFHASYRQASVDYHTGLVRDASDSGIWKLFEGVTADPTGTVDFTGASYSTLKLGTLQATSVPTVGTITSGVWNGSVIGAAYIDSAIARLVSPSFTTPSLGVATATSINGTSIPTSSTLLTSNSISSTVQAWDADLDAIAALAGTTGILSKTAANTWTLDTNTYSTTAHNHTINSLSNVVITGTPTDGQALVWDTTTSKWVNETVSGSALTAGTGINIASGVISADLTVVAPLESPTFTGTVSLPALTTIGTVTSIQLSYLDTLTEPVQYRLTSLTNSVNTINTDLGFKADLVGGVLKENQIPSSLATTSYVTDNFQQLTQKNAANGYAGLDATSKVAAQYLDLSTVAPLASPTFTGTVVLPGTTSIGTVTAAEISYLIGATSSLQNQIDSKLSEAVAQSDYLTITNAANTYQSKDEDLAAIAALVGTSGFLKKAGTNTWTLDDSTYLTTTSAASTYLTIDTAVNGYAPIAAPTFTGIVVLPSTTSIGTVTSTEIGYLDGVTSSIQTQIDGKQASHDHPYQTQNASLSSIAALAGTAGFIKFDGGSTYSVDSNTYLVRNQPTVDTAIIAGTTTFSIANAIATTLNIGGAATAITIGSTNANAETVIRTPKIGSNASSIQLFNTTSTTVEFAGAATTLHVGGTTTAGSTFNIAANATASGNQKIVNLATDAESGSSTVINIGTSNDGTINVYGDVVAHGTIEVPTPTINAQAANKGYVDALAAGINIKEQAKYATTVALTVTYTAGTSDTSGGFGEGALITATSNGALSPDGTEVTAGERVLVKNQTDAKENGIYVVTDPGDGDSPFILTRASDFNGESATNGVVKNGDYVFITAGSVNSNASFVVSQGGTSTTPSGAIKFGTDSVVFSQYSGVPGNITSLGVVTQGVWQSTRIQKEYLDDELATLANPTFTGTVTVPTPVTGTNAATKAYVDNSIAANAAALPDIIPLDDIRGQFNGIDSRFLPTFQGETLSILNPLRLLLNINGIIQSVDFPEYVWQSFLPREGFMVDNDGYIAFSEVPPAGSTFDARLMPGPNINSVKKGYPFRAVDILLGV